MKFHTAYERLTHQTFELDAHDLRRAVEAYVRSRPDIWAKTPVGCVERIEIEFGDTEDGGPNATVTRTFAKAEANPEAGKEPER